MFNGGLLALELPETAVDLLFQFRKEQAEISFDLEGQRLTIAAGGHQEEIAFSLAGFDRTLVEAEGWLGFAAARY